MAAIGGIFNFNGAPCDTRGLVKMSGAMLRRGGKDGRKEAAVLEGAGLFWISSNEKNTSAQGEDGVIAICDGEVYAEYEEGDRSGLSRFFGETDAQLCLDAYRRYGVDLGEHISGDFALSVYDKRKKELLLLRMGDGVTPLYYGIRESSIGFASEISGVLAFFDCPAEVDRITLRAHVLSRGGQYSGADLYRGIYNVGRMGGCLCSGLGISPLGYTKEIGSTETEHTGRTVGGDLACPDEEGMAHLLREILHAFGYPQFDCLMPSFLRDIQRVRETGGAIIDGSLCCDIAYSLERRDALSVLGGYRPLCVPPRTCSVKERELKKMEKTMLSLFSERDRQKTDFILGEDIESAILREKNTARRIRFLGMALQSVIWYDDMRITLV